MTADEAKALHEIRGLAGAGRVRLTRHGRAEMYNAGSQVEDVCHALAFAHSVRAARGGRWKVTGEDIDGDDLDIVVVIDDGVLVVTVM